MPKRGTTKELVPEYSLTEVALAFAALSGCSGEETAGVLGISAKWAYTMRERTREKVDALARKLEPLVKTKKRDLVRMAREQFHAEMESLLGGCAVVLREAMEKGDINAAMGAVKEVMNRQLGQPTQKLDVNNRGSVNHVHYIPTTEALAALTRFDEDIIEDSALHGRVKLLHAVNGRTVDVTATPR